MPRGTVMIILILGFPEDEHARHIERHLQWRGCDVLILDTRPFPARIALSFDPRSGSGSIRFPSGREILWSDVGSVYWRNYGGPGSSPLPDSDQAFIAENDSRSLLEFLLAGTT